MAKAFKAVTKIARGEVGATGQNEIKVFEPGEVVRGLGREVMKDLWDNGALEEVDVVEVEKASDAPASGEGDPNNGQQRVAEPTS